MEDKKSVTEIMRALAAQAEDKFGKERAGELRPELELMAEQFAKLHASTVEVEDVP